MPALRLTRQSARLRQVCRQASRVSAHASHSEDSTLITWDEAEVPHTQLLLSWLLFHPADRVVLFRDGKLTDEDERSSGRLKNDIYAVIANFIFSICSIYSTAYTSHPEQFSSSVANRLTTLKSKYRSCITTLKSTGGGVNPGDGHTNLIDKVKADFPWFDECNALWAETSNDERRLSSAPTGNTDKCTTDFLPILPKRAMSTLRPVHSPPSQDPRLQHAHGELPADPSLEEPGDLDSEDESTAGFHLEDEETDVEEDNFGQDESLYGGASTGSSGGYDEEIQERRSSSRVLSKTRTPSSKDRTTFRMAPHPYHPRTPTVTTSSISPSISSKNVLSRFRSKIAGKLDELNEEVKDQRVMSMMMKTERYNMKISYHSRGRELDFLKAERERERVDAELTHRRQQESKQVEIEHEKMKIQLAELETQQLLLKIKLAELQRGTKGG